MSGGGCCTRQRAEQQGSAACGLDPQLPASTSARAHNPSTSDILFRLASCGAENSVYMKLERWIAAKWGVEPRGWYEPDYSWQEQQRPGTAA